jgi:hypothetical protein
VWLPNEGIRRYLWWRASAEGGRIWLRGRWLDVAEARPLAKGAGKGGGQTPGRAP